MYHGLGTGKTCSAISVSSEEMRDYYKQMGIKKKIVIVASPNVQENFKLQLFDKRKLTMIDGLWNLKACTGSKFLKEINPMNMKGLLTKEKIIQQVNIIINTNYLFIGYIQFSNWIYKLIKKFNSIKDANIKNEKINNQLKKTFNDRLIVIDEVHNIRITANNPKKKSRSTIINACSINCFK